jgi:hypothetical protein
MADALFNPAREGFLAGEIDWNGATIKVSLIRGYTFNTAHKFVADATSAGATLVATATLASTTVTNGVADAGDVIFNTVPTGTACNALLIYQSSAPTGGADLPAASQRLIAYIDSASGLPVTPNGGNINVVWDNGSNRIFNL